MLVGWERIAKEEAGWGASPPRLRWRRKGSSILFILNLIFLSAIKKDRKQHPLQCFFLFFFVSNGRTRGATCFCSGMAGTGRSSMLGLFFHFSFNFQPWHLGLRINDRQRRSLFFILSATFVTFHKKVLLAYVQRFLLLVPCWWSRTSVSDLKVISWKRSPFFFAQYFELQTVFRWEFIAVTEEIAKAPSNKIFKSLWDFCYGYCVKL